MMGSLRSRLASLRRPDGPAPAEVPAIGDAAPECPHVAPGTPRVVAFLGHTGDVFGERLLGSLRETARENRDVAFVAVTHGDPAAATAWCGALGLDRSGVRTVDAVESDDRDGAGPENLHVVVDEGRELYAAWGLGLGGVGYLFRPAVLRARRRARRGETTAHPPSGTRWQRAGVFGVDPDGTVRTRHVAAHAADRPDARVLPSFLERPTEVRETTTGSVQATPRHVAADATPAVTRVAPDPRVVDDDATAAVRRVTGTESTVEPGVESEDGERERQRLRTDGG
ncbi:hypothetical protein [Haloglomus litoreum]|uniref:hypothetical protein n=1 Tax=Haloglomus litoreum TaxID=3034026 RepID=UPI0023E7CB82|nr:hypothetical protein [Haloglomus sp. DT116]